MIFKIDQRLKEKGKTMAWLSEVANISYPNILKICKGENKSIKINTIDKICTALECHISDILEDEIHTKTERRLRISENPSSKISMDKAAELLMEYNITDLKNLQEILDQQKRS